MARSNRLWIFAYTIALLLPTFTPVAYGGLLGPPSSFVRALPGGRYMLVFLAPLPRAEDAGKIGKLPDGREVNLREMFSASGCYEVGSTTPLWTTPWEGYEHWAISEDCRYLVRCNFAGFKHFRFLEGGELSWGLKFYNRGKEIKNYGIADLVDYPNLLPLSDCGDYGYDWIDFRDGDLDVRGGIFDLQTTTHEHFRFDVATGEIIDQLRMWRAVARITWCIVVATILWRVVILCRRRTTPRASPAIAIQALSRRRRLQDFVRRPGYSLRFLLFATTAIALLCFVLPRWPKCWPLLLIAGVAVYVTRATMRYQRNVGFGLRSILAGLGWLSAYALSSGPVAAFLRGADVPNDVFFAVLLTLYRPLIWVHMTWPVIPLWPEWWNQLWESMARLLQ